MRSSVQTVPQAGLIIREREPLNLESPFDQLSEDVGDAGRLTSNELFYIRSHFCAPSVDVSRFSLRIEGAVEAPFSLSVDEIRRLPSERRIATLECAGNGRVFLTPSEEGAQWELGAVGTAEWTGVPLALLLERAKVLSSAVELVFEGADRGKPKEKPQPPGEISFARSLPLERAGQTLLAYEMNGEPIPLDHGGPLRAIVPGCYGVASVKWLTRIAAVERPFQGFWQTSDYAYWDETAGLPVRRPLLEMKVKSSIARPRMRESVEAGSMYVVFGAAWTAAERITKVEVSADDGKSWETAEIIDEPVYGVWSRWRYRWRVPEHAGSVTLRSRATDSSGAMQPPEHDKNYGSYAIHHTVGIEVEVRAG